MQFMVMHRVNASIEAGEKPGPELIAQMGQLIGDGFATGKILDAAGLQRTATRLRLRFEQGRCTETHGPLQGQGEPIAAFALITVKSRDEAVGWTRRLASALGDAEFDLGPVVEPWDLGVAPKPQGELPQRFVLTYKSGRGDERALPPLAAVQPVLDEMKRAGVLTSHVRLEPSDKGARLDVRGGKRSLVDGPFAESKELIAGFTLLQADSLAEVKDWTFRYAAIIGEVVVDIRQIAQRS